MTHALESAQLDLVMESHRERRAWALGVIREEMRRLYRGRSLGWMGEPGFVCGDDVRRLLRRRPELDVGRTHNWLGAVWLRSEWRDVGEHISTVPGGHLNRVRRWALR